MVSLTTQQRDLIQQLLKADSPVVIAELAERLKLTPRQVSYRLKPIKTWLAQRDAVLKATPGVGIGIECTPDQRLNLLQELNSNSKFNLILTAGQRQQLFTLNLLTVNEPFILNRLGYAASVSRTTALKDLDAVEAWIQRFGLEMIRRPNYGLLLKGPELIRRQALAALLWGDTPFDDPITRMSYNQGLISSLPAEATVLPIVKQVSQLLDNLDTQAALAWVTYAEDQQGGRFTDNTVLHLVLALAIQAQRVRANQIAACNEATLEWLSEQKVWPVAVDVSHSMWPEHSGDIPPAEVAAIAMHLLAGLRDHMWPGDLEIDPTLTELITILMEEVAKAFSTPGLQQDTALRDGLVAHIIPAFMRQRFKLWSPPTWSDGELSRQYTHEYNIARELAKIVAARTGVNLPDGEIDTLTLLLRAAFIRERPNQPRRVYIICPSGMATAQLLVARLKARFPSLEIMGVLSVRELTPERVNGAHLLISTVPLLQPPKPGLPVITVHPLLLPEDIETITNWLT